MPNQAFTASAGGMPDEAPTIRDAIDIICRAIALNNLVSIVGQGNAMMMLRAGEAIAVASDVIDDHLVEAKNILYALNSREG